MMFRISLPSLAAAAILAIQLLVVLPVSARAGTPPDYAAYEVPLYQQIVGRIRAKISAKLGHKPSKHDRYFMVPFAYQNRGNDPALSHSFITVIRVLGTGQRTSGASELMTGKYRHWRFEAYNISWIPQDFLEHPDLCVFGGFGSRIFPSLNRCPVVEGKNYNLEDTIKIAVNAKVAVGMWGPYEITKPGFDLGIRRKHLLDSGQVKYRADDRGLREKGVAINCFHAMASLEEPSPYGGLLNTGFLMWGLNGTKRVLLEYTGRESNQEMLRNRIDIRRDVYGFVYAPTPGSRRIYKPFPQASAYHR